MVVAPLPVGSVNTEANGRLSKHDQVPARRVRHDEAVTWQTVGTSRGRVRIGVRLAGGVLPGLLPGAPLPAERLRRALLHVLVRNKEMWGANLAGTDFVDESDSTVDGLRRRFAAAVEPYRCAVRRIIDAREWDIAGPARCRLR